MLSRLRNIFRPNRSNNYSNLAFELDYVDGKNRVKVFELTGDEKIPITNIKGLLSNLYRFQKEDGAVVLICDEDRKLLSSLKSLNPEITDDGSLEFELIPPAFNYLRSNTRIIETDNAKRIKISKLPVRPAARVDFHPESGIRIDFGLQHPDLPGDQVIPTDQVKLNKKHDYFILGEMIVPAQSGDARTVQVILSRPFQEVAVDETPEFLTDQLPELTQKMQVSLSERASSASSFCPAVNPAIEVDYLPGKGLVLETGFQDPETESFLSDKVARRSKSGKYLILGDTFAPIASDLEGASEKIREQNGRIVPEDEIPEFLTEEIRKVKKTISKIFTSQAKKIVVHEDPKKPVLHVDFDPSAGVTLSSGYEIEDQEKIIPIDSLKTTKSGKFAMLNGAFYAIQPPNQSKAEDILKQVHVTVPFDQIPEFFKRDLVLLSKDFNAVLTDRAERIHVVDDPLEAVVRVAGNKHGWLNFEIDYKVGDRVLPSDLIDAAKQQKYVRVDDNTWIKVDKSIIGKVEDRLKSFQIEQTAAGFRVPAMEFVSLEEFIKSIGGTAELSQAYQNFINQLTGFETDEKYALPAHLEKHLENTKITLRPYQRAGVQWLKWLSNSYLHGLLADDMGLGKTLQTILLLRMSYEETGSDQHSLILAPKSVMTNWERELSRFYPEAVIFRYHGIDRTRYKNLLHSKSPVIFISTYATAANDVETLSRIPLNFLVLDEATQIKNPDSKRTKSVKALNAAHRLALSGTPVENRPAEMWSIFDFLMKGHLGTQSKFLEIYEKPILSGDQKASKDLGKRIKPFILRRKKEQVAKDLPEKIYMKEWCELSDEQRQLYGAMQDSLNKLYQALQAGVEVNYAVNILPVLTRLKQICDHPALLTGQVDPSNLYGRSEKFDWILEKIEEIQESGEQVVVFSHFLNMLNLIQCALDQKHISFIRIDGSTNNRQPLIDQFNQGRASVALLSLQAAGYGITLTAANHVIHADRWWNPAVEDQATDRVHRIGQIRNVYVYHILVENTLEERIEELLNEKRGIADDIISVASDGAMRWTRDELLYILKPF